MQWQRIAPAEGHPLPIGELIHNPEPIYKRKKLSYIELKQRGRTREGEKKEGRRGSTGEKGGKKQWQRRMLREGEEGQDKEGEGDGEGGITP